jgi:hypothetical protein
LTASFISNQACDVWLLALSGQTSRIANMRAKGVRTLASGAAVAIAITLGSFEKTKFRGG